MRKTRHFLVLLLMMQIIFFLFPISYALENNNDGVLFEFGSYPQTQVEDISLIHRLESVNKSWKSYKYYTGTNSGRDGLMKTDDYMLYADFLYDGIKYRAVMINSYRPYYTYYKSSDSPDYTYQDDNGYFIGTTYYFRYDPLVWRVLNPIDKLVICEYVIDSQPFQNFNYYNSATSECWMSSDYSYYSNDYAHSTIREWLNTAFYTTAFTSEEQLNINQTTLDNSPMQPTASLYSYEDTTDRVFLLSYEDSFNTEYGFFENQSSVDDPRRLAFGTDYAECQGLRVEDSSATYYGGTCGWWLRTPSYTASFRAQEVEHGATGITDFVDITYNGIRPACRLLALPSSVHTHTPSTYTQPSTCTVPGYTITTCSECNSQLDYQVLPLAPHQYGEWVTVKEPTSTETGLRERTCTVCKVAKETEELPKLESFIAEDTNSGISVIYEVDAYSSDQVQVRVVEDFTGSQYLIKSYDRYEAWNIKTYIDGAEVQPGAPVTVQVPLHEGYDPSNIAVYHINSITGELESLKDVRVENGYIIFTATSFSLYIIVDESSAENPNMCHWCGKDHSGNFFQKIIGFFHNILAKIFGNKY